MAELVPLASLPESPAVGAGVPGPPAPGEVVLVGAGPGDPGLVTVAGLACLRRADVVVYDRLVHPDLLAEAAPGCELVDVGKRPGVPGVTQAEISALLVEHARRGRRVVRLKGGDPFLFGRGGEELLALGAAGIPASVIPGVTSALAAPAAAGIPLTHRGLARSVAVVTGHTADGAAPVWSSLAGVDTLVVLMGVAALESICRELVAHGRSPGTPAAIVERATLPSQRVLRAPLGELAPRARALGVRSPAVIVVGEVVGALADAEIWTQTAAARPSRPVERRNP
jgi:uroporphyrin-III C-methyltransferase